MNALSLLVQGGPVMYVLFGISVVAMGLIAFKMYQFSHVRLRDTEFIEPLLAKLRKGDFSESLHDLEIEKNPSAELLADTVRACLNDQFSVEDIHSEVGRSGSRVLRELEHSLRVIAAIAQLSPLLGLLGTVLGMINAFYKLQGAQNQVSPALLAGGIWEALLTTAAGLMIAIPTLAALYYLEGEIDKIRSTMKDATTKVILLLRPRNSRSLQNDRGEAHRRTTTNGI